MAKLQVKKSPAPRKIKKETKSEGITEPEEKVKIQEASEQAKVENKEVKTTGEAAENEPTEKPAEGIKELVEEVKATEEALKPEIDDTKELKTPTPRLRKKSKKKKATADGEETKPSADAKSSDKKIENDFSGLIFMCNQMTKRECFLHHVFGLPEAKKDLVLQLKPGMKLFLYDIDLRLLYGVYEASSKGGMNLVSKAFNFNSSSKGFPAQVRFKILKDCMPLSENAFKPSIKENYVGRSRFKIELNAQQVKKLQQLFRPIGSSSKNTGTRFRGHAQFPVGRSGQKQEVSRDYNVRRTAQLFSERRSSVPDYSHGYSMNAASDLEMRRLDYTREPGYVPADPYVLARAHLREVPAVDPGYSLVNPAYDTDSLYRQRASVYSDSVLREASKRPLDELYLDDRHSLPVPKRTHIQDELPYRDLEYQRSAASHPDERLLSRYYASGLY